MECSKGLTDVAERSDGNAQGGRPAVGSDGKGSVSDTASLQALLHFPVLLLQALQDLKLKSFSCN